MKKKKIKLKASVFLKAARHIERMLKKGDTMACCQAIEWHLHLLGSMHNRYAFHQTPEFKFFKKLFGKKRANGGYWFGKPYRLGRLGDHLGVNVKNQEKRIKALIKTYHAARRHNES